MSNKNICLQYVLDTDLWWIGLQFNPTSSQWEWMHSKEPLNDTLADWGEGQVGRKSRSNGTLLHICIHILNRVDNNCMPFRDLRKFILHCVSILVFLTQSKLDQIKQWTGSNLYIVIFAWPKGTFQTYCSRKLDLLGGRSNRSNAGGNFWSIFLRNMFFWGDLRVLFVT